MSREDKKVIGRIFDIQKYSIHDGPGIRTIVFLKGCLLRCRWCCNPESQEYPVQTMMVQGKPKTIGTDISVEEVMEEIVKDLPYYRRSGGGVTLSGGEALCQPGFATALLKECKEYGLNTAIESTACVSYDVIEKLLPYLDLYLLDIKHMDSQKHKKYTGQPNELILENARKLAKAGVNIIIRIPVVPTFNHTKGEILDIAQFTKSLGIRELHLLPYHRLGQDKYQGLGRDYELSHIEPMNIEYMKELLAVVESVGLHSQIGG